MTCYFRAGDSERLGPLDPEDLALPGWSNRPASGRSASTRRWTCWRCRTPAAPPACRRGSASPTTTSSPMCASRATRGYSGTAPAAGNDTGRGFPVALNLWSGIAFWCPAFPSGSKHCIWQKMLHEMLGKNCNCPCMYVKAGVDEALNCFAVKSRMFLLPALGLNQMGGGLPVWARSGGDAGAAAVLPHLRHVGTDVQRHLQRRGARDAAPLRAGVLPADPGHPPASFCLHRLSASLH